MIKHLSLYLLLLMGFSSAGQNMQQEPYEFPVKPGFDEWKKFRSGKEMVDACQVPSSILQELSTAALVKTCLNYPLNGNIAAFNDLQTGMRSIIAEFNGLRELMQRPDAGRELLTIYDKMKPSGIGRDWSLLEKGQYSFSFVIIEMLLAQHEIVNMLAEEQMKELVSGGLQKFKEKEILIETFGGNGLRTSAFVIARVLDKDKYLFGKSSIQAGEVSQQSLKMFLDRAVPDSENVVIDVIVKAQSYISR